MEERYRLRAFVGEGSVQETGDEGFSTFTQAFIRRPAECRYAVAETSEGNFIVWDMFAAMKQPDGITVRPSGALNYEDLDQAIMATQLTYKPHDQD